MIMNPRPSTMHLAPLDIVATSSPPLRLPLSTPETISQIPKAGGLNFLLQAANQCEEKPRNYPTNNSPSSTKLPALWNCQRTASHRLVHPSGSVLSEVLGFTGDAHPVDTVRVHSSIRFSSPRPGQKNVVRKGRWTTHEEEYAQQLITSYRKGNIRLRHSMSLRKFLAEALNCDPMRISKKFPCLKAYKVRNQKGKTTSSSSASVTKKRDCSLKSIMNTSFVAEKEEECAQPMDELPSNKDYTRHGRWTLEEEDFAEGLINAFKTGILPLPGSTSLRKLLAEVLQCPPMRVSKKFVGCVRKYRYYQERVTLPPYHVDQALNDIMSELYRLEARFVKSIVNIGPM